MSPGIAGGSWKIRTSISKSSYERGAKVADSKRRWFGLVAIALGVATIIVDSTIVNVAVPSIIKDLGVTSTQAQWIQEVYTLVFASTLLVFGRLSDRFGRRAMFALGVVIFVIASLLAAQSQSGEFLIAARFIQGIGGAMMLPTSLSILNSTFFGKERGIAFAIWGSTIGAAAALGPLVGGWLTTDLSWRWAFGINLPLGAAVLSGTFLFVVESKGEKETGADYLGALLSIVSMGSLVFALIEGRNYGWWKKLDGSGISIIPLFILVFILSTAIFAKVQLDRNQSGKPVLFDISLLRINSFRNANFAAAIVSLGEFGLLFSLPLWLQNVLGYSAFGTGVILLSLAVGSFLASGVGGAVGAKSGPVAVVRIGISLELLGVFVTALVIASRVDIWKVCVGLFIYGMGVGLATAQLTGVVLADVPVERSGQASGMASTMRQLGSALGIAVLGTTLFSSFGSALNTLPMKDGIVKSAGAIIPQLPDAARKVSSDGLSHASVVSAYVAVAFLFFGLLATFAIKKSPAKN